MLGRGIGLFIGRRVCLVSALQCAQIDLALPTFRSIFKTVLPYTHSNLTPLTFLLSITQSKIFPALGSISGYSPNL